MTPEKNQAELDRCKDIAFAAIEYSIEKQSGLLQPDQLAHYKNFHRIWKEQVEKRYQESDLDKLKKLLQNLTMIYKITGDLDFVKYIKEKTGHDYDLLGNIYERIDKIIARNRIANRKERNDVATMIELYRRTGIGQENAALLQNLSMDFHNTQVKEKSPETMIPPMKYLTEINSPDNKKYIAIYESHHKDYPSTSVNIHIKEDRVTWGVYAIEGINLAVKAYWKENNTVVIETKKDYKSLMKHWQKERLQDLLMIEYVFID